MTREEAAAMRVAFALGEIQEAQNHLGKAQEALSSIIGAVPEGRRLAKLYQAVKREWYRLDERERKKTRSGQPFKLDREPEERYESEWGK